MSFSPSLGRWVQVDPILFESGDINHYRGFGNDPLGSVDPFGLADKRINETKKVAAGEFAFDMTYGTSQGGGYAKGTITFRPDKTKIPPCTSLHFVQIVTRLDEKLNPIFPYGGMKNEVMKATMTKTRVIPDKTIVEGGWWVDLFGTNTTWKPGTPVTPFYTNNFKGDGTFSATMSDPSPLLSMYDKPTAYTTNERVEFETVVVAVKDDRVVVDMLAVVKWGFALETDPKSVDHIIRPFPPRYPSAPSKMFDDALENFYNAFNATNNFSGERKKQIEHLSIPIRGLMSTSVENGAR